MRPSTLVPCLFALLLSGCASLTGTLQNPLNPLNPLNQEAQEALHLAHTLRDNQRMQASYEVYARMDSRGQLNGDYLLEYASVAATVRPAQETLALFKRAQQALGGELQALPVAKRLALCNGQGRANLALGQAVQAERDFRCAVQAAPDSPQALNGLGVALNLQERNEEAREQFSHALHSDPAYSPALNNLALAWLASGDNSRAIGLLNQARGLNDISLQLNLALAYVLSGQDDAAQAVLLESLQAPYAERVLSQFRNARERVAAGAPLASELLAASQQPLTLSERN